MCKITSLFLKLSSNLSFSIILVLFSHLFHVLLFSFIYFIEIDNMQGSHDNSYIDLIYYSISTYTTLGIGDIHFYGSARIVSGIQAYFWTNHDCLVCVTHIFKNRKRIILLLLSISTGMRNCNITITSYKW